MVGLLSLAGLIPLLATAFIGGVLADAIDRRRIVRLTEVGLCVGSAALMLNSVLSHPQLWILFAISVLFAALDGLQRPSLDAMVPLLVSPDKLAATASIMSIRSQIGMIAAPALTGVIIAAGGLTLTYALDVASYVVSLIFLFQLGDVARPVGQAELSLGSIGAGMSYAWRRKDLLGSYVVDMSAMFFGIPNALFPQIATHLGGASALGVLYASPAMGSFLVTATSGWVRRVRRYGRMIAIAAAVWGVGIILLGFAVSLWAAALGLIIAGAGDMVSGLGRSMIWNQSIPDALRGRLAGLEMLSYSSGPSLGNVESGILERLVGLRTSIVAGGSLCVVATALLSLMLPAFWRYDAREGEKLRRAPG